MIRFKYEVVYFSDENEKFKMLGAKFLEINANFKFYVCSNRRFITYL